MFVYFGALGDEENFSLSLFVNDTSVHLNDKSFEVIQGQVCGFGGVFSGREYEGAIVDIEGESVVNALPFADGF